MDVDCRAALLHAVDASTAELGRSGHRRVKRVELLHHGGDVVHRLTRSVARRIRDRAQSGTNGDFPPTLVFLSTVDATVSTDAVVDRLLSHLPPERNELVLFDINRVTDIEPLMQWDPEEVIQTLQQGSGQTFTLSVVTNETEQSQRVVMASKRPAASYSAVTHSAVGAADGPASQRRPAPLPPTSSTTRSVHRMRSRPSWHEVTGASSADEVL